VDVINPKMENIILEEQKVLYLNGLEMQEKMLLKVYMEKITK